MTPSIPTIAAGLSEAQPTTAEVLRDLARVQAVFQQRAIVTHMTGDVAPADIGIRPVAINFKEPTQ